MARGTVRAAAPVGILVLAVVSGCSAFGSPAETSTSVSAPPTADPKGDGTLVLAGLLERSGDGAAAQSAQNTAIHLAVEDVNAAGGVNGAPITVVDSDTASPTVVGDLDTARVDLGIGAPPEVLIQPLSAASLPTVWTSPVAAAQLSQATAGTNLVLGIEPTTQVRAIAQTLTSDGRTSVGVIAVNNDDGKGGVEALTDALGEAQVALATEPIYYEPTDTSFTVPVTKLKGASPDAIVVIGGDEAAGVIPELSLQRIGPANVPTYVSGPTPAALTALPAGSLVGLKAAGPGSEVSAEFDQQLRGRTPDLTSVAGAPEAYDAVVLAALAATAAKDDDGMVVAKNVPAVSSDGTTCTSFAECSGLLADGQDIAYVGKSGPSQLGEQGRRRAGQVTIAQFDDKNAISATNYVTVGA